MNERIPPSVDSTSVSEFRKDLDKLNRFRHIESDLEVAVNVIKAEPFNLARCFRAEGLGKDCVTLIFVLKKFRSTDLRSMNEIRLVYAFENPKNRITLIEIYFKGDRKSEDKERILKYFSEKSPFRIKS